ncbi:uncharacterized protein N7473_009126 [Penicillium subrubescens]|uniref:uncharacterized protein n=1 Tax=Penicillium subrubescens TaxID=1316194 RepID=UPI0025454CB6|nr:uncharacterized protein N7473_009126 [Penicillium subrubescens]KAJ5886452.1 hypothetical protein N7473_009126 [Penicillium subrubescens]
MTIFFEGSLQEGIALAVREAKAVVCFVRDDAQLSSTWEQEYFSDNEVAQALGGKSVSLRLTAGTQEAGFLSSFCPVAEFPALIVIKNGKLEEYLLPGVSKDEFKGRILAVLGRQQTPSTTPAQQPQASTFAVDSNSSYSPPNTTPSAAISTPAHRRPSQSTNPLPSTATHNSQESAKSKKPLARHESAKPQPGRQDHGKKPAPVPENKATASQPTKPTIRKPPAPTVEDEEPKPRPPAPKGPPSQYRLQVRLFDGRSIRSSFTPTQTIRNDVRPWLDEQMTDDKRPYNLKHVLTPLPSRTLSVAEESQALQDLGLGSTANLVMIPVASYTEAYTAAAANSLPARGISAVYNMVSSVASSATSFVGSFIGYGTSAPESSTQAPSSPSPPPPETTRRRRTSGLNIRTLHDQRDERDDNQFYNGNQLNFEPRNQDRKDN